MIPYLIPVILTIFCAIHYDINNRKDAGKYFAAAFLFIYLTLLIGLRYRVGGDSLTYEGVFRNESDLSTWTFNYVHIYQPGFTFLYAVAKSIHDSFTTFQIIHAILLNTMLFIFIWKNTRYRFIALCIIEYAVYLYFSTEILREVLAVMVFALNYPSYKNRRWLQFYLGVALALLFHPSAAILIILPLMRKWRYNRRFLLYCACVVALFPIGLKVMAHMPSNVITDKAAGYSGEFYGLFATFTYVLSGGLFPLLYLFLTRKNKERPRFENFICVMTFFGLGAVISPLIFGRFTNYFVLFFILSLADYLHSHICSKSNKWRHNAIAFILLILICYSNQYLYLGKYIRYIPYSSIYNPMDINRDYNLE